MATKESIQRSAIVASNAAELISKVVLGISGNDISNTINGSKITRDLISTMVFIHFNQKIKELAIGGNQ